MTRNFDNWIQQYVDYTSYLEAPTPFHFWTAVGTIAGALRGKVWIDMGYFRWKPNFFLIFVAPPGVVSKSTTLDVGMDLLRQIEGVHFGPASATWQAMTEAFIESEVPVAEIGDVMSPLTIAASELGTFFDPRNREMIDVLNDLWDGRRVPWKRRTKGEGESEIRNPWLNFLGCTTPAWIQENFPHYAIGGGFTSRTLFVWGQAKRRLVAYPQLEIDAAGSHKFQQTRLHLISDLKQISRIAGAYRLTTEAYDWGEAWYERHWTQESEFVDRAVHGGYISRKQTHLHKTAMVIAASRHERLEITSDDLTVADRMITALEEHFQNIFSAIGDNRDIHNMQAVATTLMAYPGAVPAGTLYRRVMQLMTWQQFELCCESLIAAEIMAKYSNGQTVMLRLGIAAKRFGKAAEMPSQPVDPQSSGPTAASVPSPTAQSNPQSTAVVAPEPLH